MSRIVVINGHPDKESFNAAVAQAYVSAAKAAGAQVRYIAVGELQFNPNLQYGYRKRMELEPDLVNALNDLKWSDHQVWIHPLWWLGLPALLKGFVDRAFLPGITFKSSNGKSEGVFQGKTARIITTAGDLSHNAYKDIYGCSGLIQLKKGILEYCGIGSVSETFMGPLDKFSENDRKNSLYKVQVIAQDDSESVNRRENYF